MPFHYETVTTRSLEDNYMPTIFFVIYTNLSIETIQYSAQMIYVPFGFKDV